MFVVCGLRCLSRLIVHLSSSKLNVVLASVKMIRSGFSSSSEFVVHMHVIQFEMFIMFI